MKTLGHMFDYFLRVPFPYLRTMIQCYNDTMLTYMLGMEK